MVIEGGVAVGAGVVAHSVALTAFGFDSFIELFSAAVVLRRVLERSESEERGSLTAGERMASKLVGLALYVLIGYIVIGVLMATDKERPPLDWKSAQWLPVWLIGMGIITWQGQYSGGAIKAPLNTGRIPFWWDMLIVAAFSLLIYFWAMASRVSREEQQRLVMAQAAEPEPPSDF